MSYARFGMGSDVYVFLNGDGKLECCGCLLQAVEWVDTDTDIDLLGGYLVPVGEIIENSFDSTFDMIRHLHLHVLAGHTVPDGLYLKLVVDDEENFGG